MSEASSGLRNRAVHVEVMRELLRITNNLLVDGLSAHGEGGLTNDGREEVRLAIRNINGARQELKG